MGKQKTWAEVEAALKQSYLAFWDWFQKKEKDFFNTVKNNDDIEKNFFEPLSTQLWEIKEGFYFLTGMYDDDTVELILTADGNANNMVFVEELVGLAPQIPGWKFTPLKQPLDIADANISMGNHQYNSGNIYFFENVMPDYPDEIDISVVHDDLTEENRDELANGTYIFLDNYLGEFNFMSQIDGLSITGRHLAAEELVPISKLKDFLNWREKEFIEKYDGMRHNTENDNYSIFEGELENGNLLFASINMDLLKWEAKASHPWVGLISFGYKGDENGIPLKTEYDLLNDIESEIEQLLKEEEGELYIGRQTADYVKEIYFACKDFRKLSKVFFFIQNQYGGKFKIEYDIYKDKYWQTFERFLHV